jgi:hypothetical protein
VDAHDHAGPGPYLVSDGSLSLQAFDAGTGGAEGRRGRLLALLEGHAGGKGEAEPVDGTAPRLVARLERLCLVAVDELGVSGAGVTVMASVPGGLAGHRDQIYATGDLARRLEDLQLTAGEGPCLDALRDGVPVLVADLVAAPGRWLGFGPEAVAVGAAAVFSLPLQVGAVRLGTLDLHRDTVGGLEGDRLADALLLAGLATEVLLELAHESRDDGEAGGGLPEHGGSSGAAGWLTDVHATVHQASGMVAAREHIGVGEALLRLRAHAFTHSEPITRVAQRVIDRDLVLPHHDHPDDPSGPGPADTDAETER